MRVFVSEFVCGGGWPDDELPGSLATEGRAMLCAAVEDFARIPGVRVTTTWDARLGPPPFESVHTIVIESAADELPVFRELAQLCDATLVIAPELDDVLLARCQIVDSTSGRLLGPGTGAVKLCSSKYRLSMHLASAGVPVVRTDLCVGLSPASPPRPSVANELPRLIRMNSCPRDFPAVIKPDNGAGSQSTYLIRDFAEFSRLKRTLADDAMLRAAVFQPFVPGKSVSVALLVSRDGEHIEALPPAQQTLSDDGRFRYLGGAIPARGVDLAAIQQTARDACRAVPGLRGYVGVDLIVPDDNPDRPIVVEINPRLTTSYIGYRRLTDDNLAARMLDADASPPPIAWREGFVTFDAAGNTS